MSKEKINEALSQLLADTYALYLKTQNYHWHVKGLHFSSLHAMFEGQYTTLSEAVDGIAEAIVIRGGVALATFGELSAKTSIKDGDHALSAKDMLNDLNQSHAQVIQTIQNGLTLASDAGDEAAVSLLGARLEAHEKDAWMISASLA